MVYVCGYFNTIGGASRNSLAALNIETGNATDWNPESDGDVTAFTLFGDVLIAGGQFLEIGKQKRNNLAVLNCISGKAAEWSPVSDNSNPDELSIPSMATNGNSVYVSGQLHNHRDPYGMSYIARFTGIDTATAPVRQPRTGRQRTATLEPVLLRGSAGEAHLCYTLTNRAPVSASLYTVQGRRVAQLVTGTQAPGSYRIPIRMSGFAKGLYLVKFRAGSMNYSLKVPF